MITGTLPVSDHEGRALSTLTEFIGLQRTELQPPDDISRGMFGRGIRLALTHRVAADGLAAAVLLALSTVWLVGSPFARLDTALIQTALIAPLAFRRIWPSAVFLAVAAIAFGQWLLNVPLLGDVALLVALYTVAAHESRIRAAAAAGLLEAGAVMAAVRWTPAGTLPRSLLFLTATVVAALFAGRTVASGSRYLAWMDERARRLEVERDQQAVIAAAAERTRIARELHDIVSHSLSVVITLADAAAVVSRADPARGAEAMTEVSEVGRLALTDMRAMRVRSAAAAITACWSRSISSRRARSSIQARYRLPEATVRPANSAATTVADRNSSDRGSVPAGVHRTAAMITPTSSRPAAAAARSRDSWAATV